MDESENLYGKVIVITGGSGFLGSHFCEIFHKCGAIPIILDIVERNGLDFSFYECDITNEERVQEVANQIEKKYRGVDVLINNAANNPKLDFGTSIGFSKFEDFSLEQWNDDIAVGITGAMICTKVFGTHMAERGKGSIINIGSVYSDLIAPNQSLYDVPKPVTYNVVKAALVGLTKYTATYWGRKNIRCNCVSFSGVFNNQPEDFIAKYVKLSPMHRMMEKEETGGIVLFLASDKSSFVTGANLVVDGGMTSW